MTQKQPPASVITIVVLRGGRADTLAIDSISKDRSGGIVDQAERGTQEASEGCFVELYLRHQRSIYSFITRLIQNYDESEDLLQKTGLVLWRKFDQYEQGTDFLAWARQIAKYEVQDYLKGRRRSKVCFSSDTVELLAEEPVDRSSPDRRHDALAKCLAELRAGDRELVARCYSKGASIRDVAQSLGRSIDGAYQSLRRIRQTLLHCIERRLAAEDRA